MTELPDWAKSTSMFVGIMICWDIIRLFLQAKVNQWVLKKDFDEIDEALDDIEEDIEEKNGNDYT